MAQRPEAERIAQSLRVLEVATAMVQAAAAEGRRLTPRERAELPQLHDLALAVRDPAAEENRP